MIVGNGIDIVEVSRMRRIFDKFGYRFLERVFTSEEIEYCFSHRDPWPHLAGRFAAKEATAKALGAKPEFWFKRIEVLNKESGEPYLKFSGEAQKTYSSLECNIIISISHSENYGVATAILDSWE